MFNNVCFKAAALALTIVLCLGNSECKKTKPDTSVEFTVTTKGGAKPQGQPSSTTPTEVTTKLPPTVREGLSLTLIVDKTWGNLDKPIQSEYSELKNALVALSLSEIAVVNYGAEGAGIWAADTKRFPIPPKLTGADFNVETLRVKLHKLCGGRKPCIDKNLRDAEARFEQHQRADEQQRNIEVAAVLDKVMTSVRENPKVEVSCTDLSEVGERIGMTKSDLVILITDGQHTCHSTFQSQIFRTTQRVLVLVTSFENEKSNGEFERRLKLLKQNFGAATVEPMVAIDSKTIIQAFSDDVR